MAKNITATANGTTVSGNNLKYVVSNLGGNIKAVTYNGTEYWKSYPEYLYNYGNQVTDVTGGWSKNSSLMTGDSLTTWPYGPKGNVYINTSNIVLEGNGDYGGVMVNTGRAINFAAEGIDKITLNCSTTIGGWGYEDYKYNQALTYANWRFAVVPALANNQAYTKVYTHDYGSWYIDGFKSDTRTESFSKTLSGLSSLNGSYYVVCGIYRSVGGTFKLTINSISCAE